MDVVVWTRGELVRCLREDVATDLLVEAWVAIYWGLHGHPMGTAVVHAHGLRGQRGQRGQILKVQQSAQTCLVLCLGDLMVSMHHYWALHYLLCHLTPLGHVGPMIPSVAPRVGRGHASGARIGPSRARARLQ